MKNKRRIVSLFLVFGMIFMNAFPIYANDGVATLASWDLVDSGKHLDWDGETNYMVQFTTAVNTWNAYKPGVIRADSWAVIEDVKISDYSGDSTTTVKISSNGTIKFNQNVMDTLSVSKKTNACLFALGSALGLGKTGNSKDVMYKHNTSINTLSENDESSYDEAYKKY